MIPTKIRPCAAATVLVLVNIVVLLPLLVLLVSYMYIYTGMYQVPSTMFAVVVADAFFLGKAIKIDASIFRIANGRRLLQDDE